MFEVIRPVILRHVTATTGRLRSKSIRRTAQPDRPQPKIRRDQPRRAYEDFVFTNRPETLTNDFFVNLLDMNIKWQVSSQV